MILCYVRVSTDEQHNGPKAQADAIQRWLSNQRDTGQNDSPPPEFSDLGVSGSVPLGERPEGGRLLATVSAGDTIVVSKLDRLFRSVADAALTIDDWNRKAITLVSITEGFDLTSAYGKAMAHIMSAMAELERSMIRERTRAALQAKKSRGERVGTVPFGWDAVGGKLVENVREQDILPAMKAWRASGMTLRQIAKELNKAGMPAKRGGEWRAQSVASVLKRQGA